MRKLMFFLIMMALSVMMVTAAFAGQKKEVKVGFVYVSPVGDAGYSYAQDLGRKGIAALPWVKTAYVESVKEGTDAERVIQNFARKGYDIIFGTSFGYMDAMVKVSKKFPKTAFMHCSGYKTTKNMSCYFGRMYQARYLTGIVAGSMTKSNIIGYVAAYPIPEVIRGINAFTLGVLSVNPKAQVRVVWSKTWYKPVLEKNAAISLLDMKADVIAQHQDSSGPQEAAQERGKYSIGYNSDMSAMAPKSHLTAAVWNWTPIMKEAVEQVRAGTWKGGQSKWEGLDKGVVGLSPMSSAVPQDVRDKVAAAKKEIIEGSLHVFAGPIEGQDGKIKVPAGKVMSDKEILGMTWFVHGVVGTTE